MLSRKPSPRPPSKTSDDESRITEALWSLGTSTVALHHQAITGLQLMSPSTSPHATPGPNSSRATHNARMRLLVIDTILSASATQSDIISASPFDIYREVLDIQKSGLVDEATCDVCWNIILKEMHRGRIDAIVHVLAGYPPDEIRAFFDDLRIRRPNWKGHLQPELNGCPSEKEILLEDDILEKSYTMLTDVVCELRDVLDMDQALLILQIEPRLTPLAILFHRPPRSRKNSLNFQLLFAFLAHLDYNPTYCGTQHRLGFDFQWVVKTAVEILCKHPTDDLLRVVAHILRAVQPLAWPDPLELEIAQLRVIFPWVEPWSPRRYLARHPASPFLSFAIFLADRSKEAAKLLVEGGLVRTLEAMYDQDFPDPRVRDDDPYVQTREEMYKLCLRLLTAVHRHCNLRDCVLMEELKSDVRRCSRELSEQYFGVFWSD